MRKFFRILIMSSAISALVLNAGFPSAYAADDAKKEDKKTSATDDAKKEDKKTSTADDAKDAKKEDKQMTPAEEGKAIAFDRRLGNCLACHMIAGGDMPGDIGPPLVSMAARYPDKAKLSAQIHDPRVANPNTIMPPFAPMGILTDEQIDKVVEFISTL